MFKGEYGHTPLCEDDLGFVAEEEPETVLVGTGQYGDLPLTPGAKNLTARYGGMAKPRPKILPFIETEKRRYVAIIRVT